MIRIGLALALCVLISSCGSIAERGDGQFTAAHQDEVRDLKRLSASESDPLDGGGWNEIAPGVLARSVLHRDGSRAEDMLIEGVEALEWVVQNLWHPRVSVVERELERMMALAMTPDERLVVEREELLSRIDALSRWRALEEYMVQPQHRLVAMSCTASRAASAMPTTASPGAKAYANARSCVANSFARASARNAHGWTHDYTEAPPGVLASASAVRYGTPCESSAWAEAYPLSTTSSYYGCP